MRWFFLIFFAVFAFNSIQTCEASNPPVPSLRESKSNPPLNLSKNNDKSSNNNQTIKQTPVSIDKKSDTTNTHNQATEATSEKDSKTASDWWLVYLTAGLVCVGIIQAILFFWQLSLLRSSIDISKSATDVALAALDRPWLVLEAFGLNEVEWLNGEGALRASFKISNYGKAPAIIKGLWVTHFRGPHHHNGLPPFDLGNVYNLPSKEDFGQFVMSNKNSILNSSGIIISDINFTVPGSQSTETFYIHGNGVITHDSGGINLIILTESYLMGIIYYEIPGQPSEVLHFCYKGNGRDSFSVFNDYTPYNERKKASLTN